MRIVQKFTVLVIVSILICMPPSAASNLGSSGRDHLSMSLHSDIPEDWVSQFFKTINQFITQKSPHISKITIIAQNEGSGVAMVTDPEIDGLEITSEKPLITIEDTRGYYGSVSQGVQVLDNFHGNYAEGVDVTANGVAYISKAKSISEITVDAIFSYMNSQLEDAIKRNLLTFAASIDTMGTLAKEKGKGNTEYIPLSPGGKVTFTYSLPEDRYSEEDLLSELNVITIDYM